MTPGTTRLSPVSFAAGVILGFIVCTYQGFVYSQRNPFHNFVRFYQALGPPGGFYPSANELMNLCKSRVTKSDVLVLVGGNSTFLGATQPQDQIWSRRLGEYLGPAYTVINLAQRGGPASGAAGTVAEALIKEGYRVIYLANITPMGWTEPDGFSTYGYLYWNARARGLLFPWEPRERYLAENNSDWRNTYKVRALFDRLSNAEDLWNALCYEKFCTAWDEVTQNNFWKPRKEFTDIEGQPAPSPQRFAARRQPDSEVIREFVKQPGGRMDRPDAWAEGAQKIDAGFVPQLRPRSLIVVTSYCSYYVHLLEKEEQQRYRAMLKRTVDTLRAAGIYSQEAGVDYDDADYADLVHLVPSGGDRLAREVAPEVRRIAHDLYAR